MIGLFDAETKMTKKMRLNYTKGKIIAKNPISEKLHDFQGHEFHYSQLDSVSSDSKFAYSLEIGEGIKKQQDGIIRWHLMDTCILTAQIMPKSLLKIV
jgi:cobyrinic acid a,c-diamide synthase